MVLNVQVTSGLENDLAIFGNFHLVGLVELQRVCKSVIERQKLKEAAYNNHLYNDRRGTEYK